MKFNPEANNLSVIPRETSDAIPSHELFPDKNAPDTVCFGYVFYKLGLDPKIVVSGLQDEILLQYFEEVLSINEANAIAFRGRDGIIEHIVYVGSNATLHHREGNSAPTTISINQLKKQYMEDLPEKVRFKMILLKLKK